MHSDILVTSFDWPTILQWCFAYESIRFVLSLVVKLPNIEKRVEEIYSNKETKESERKFDFISSFVVVVVVFVLKIGQFVLLCDIRRCVNIYIYSLSLSFSLYYYYSISSYINLRWWLMMAIMTILRLLRNRWISMAIEIQWCVHWYNRWRLPTTTIYINNCNLFFNIMGSSGVH